MIRIVDYGMGNLRSVQKALELIGHSAELTQNADEILRADRIILPGVGAFGAAMANLQKLGLVEPLRQFAESGRPFMGICLGMQLLLTDSEEQRDYQGLDIIPGKVVKFFPPEDISPATENLKVPHMGWNTIKKVSNCPLLEGVPDGSSVYFVHSYYPVPPTDAVAAVTEYGTSFCSIIWKDNVFATQFHPEKSSAVGLKMLENFASLT